MRVEGDSLFACENEEAAGREAVVTTQRTSSTNGRRNLPGTQGEHTHLLCREVAELTSLSLSVAEPSLNFSLLHPPHPDRVSPSDRRRIPLSSLRLLVLLQHVRQRSFTLSFPSLTRACALGPSDSSGRPSRRRSPPPSQVCWQALELLRSSAQ
jgi:hypothetical protein